MKKQTKKTDTTTAAAEILISQYDPKTKTFVERSFDEALKVALVRGREIADKQGSKFEQFLDDANLFVPLRRSKSDVNWGKWKANFFKSNPDEQSNYLFTQQNWTTLYKLFDFPEVARDLITSEKANGGKAVELQQLGNKIKLYIKTYFVSDTCYNKKSQSYEPVVITVKTTDPKTKKTVELTNAKIKCRNDFESLKTWERNAFENWASDEATKLKEERKAEADKKKADNESEELKQAKADVQKANEKNATLQADQKASIEFTRLIQSCPIQLAQFVQQTILFSKGKITDSDFEKARQHIAKSGNKASLQSEPVKIAKKLLH